MSKANGSDPGQQGVLALKEEGGAAAAEALGAETPEAGAADDPEAPDAPAPRVIELVNTREGCWKVLEGGERVALSEAEWRQELSRQYGNQHRQADPA